MAGCLSFDELLAIAEPQVRELQRVGDSFPGPDAPGACEAFSRQVRLLEGTVVTNYRVAAALAREAQDLKEAAELWRRMSQFCELILQVLAELKDKYPTCGTPELYDLVLDYKLAADKRFNGVQGELAWQKTDLPQGLLPELS